MILLNSFNRILVGILILPLGCYSQSYPPEEVRQGGFNSDGKSSAFQISPEVTSLLGVLGSLVGLSSPEITAILSVAKVGLGLVGTLKTFFMQAFNGTTIDFSFQNRPGVERQLLSMFEIVTLRLEQIQRGVAGTEASLKELVRGLPHMVRWEIALNTIESYTLPINSLYHRFAYYQKHKLEVENHTLVDFANSVVSHNTNSIQTYMANIHSMITPNDHPVVTGTMVLLKDEHEVDSRVTGQMSSNLEKLITSRYKDRPMPDRFMRDSMKEISHRPSIFRLLIDAIENYDSCGQRQSQQQLVMGLYASLALTQARGYAMINFAYNLLRYHNKGNFKLELRFADELYMHYSKKMTEITKESLVRAPNSFRKCDPKTHVEGETFVMITELLQGYIENEVDLNSQGTCRGKCADYQHSKVESCYLPDQQFCGKQRKCGGTVHNCSFFDAYSSVCISSSPSRRYDWIKYRNLQVLGQEGECPNLMKVDSWWRSFSCCSYCVCLCDDPFSVTSDRFVNLRPTLSDIAENKVVTGVKFVKRDRVLSIMVQEGKAIAQGQVDPGTLQWVEVEPITVGGSQYKEGEDYVTLRYETRNFDLDHLKAPKDHVVTGLRFRMLGQHVNLEMWVTPINFTTGLLSPKTSYWVSNDNTPVMAQNPRKELVLVDPDDPRKSISESELDSTSDMFITLQSSSMTADVAQLTVPFFDAQPVAPEPASWLEGVQLYHRGRRGFGGFIAFQVFNYNLTTYLEDPNDE